MVVQDKWIELFPGLYVCGEDFCGGVGLKEGINFEKKGFYSGGSFKIFLIREAFALFWEAHERIYCGFNGFLLEVEVLFFLPVYLL